jgi:hypothetical protein
MFAVLAVLIFQAESLENTVEAEKVEVEETKTDLTKGEQYFREHIEDILDGKINRNKEVAYLTDRYSDIRDTGKRKIIEDKPLKLYAGKLNDGKEEFFTVDMAGPETFRIHAKGREQVLPTHIDLQPGKNINEALHGTDHTSIYIPWHKLFTKNDDLLKQYNLKADDILVEYDRRKEEMSKPIDT